MVQVFLCLRCRLLSGHAKKKTHYYVFKVDQDNVLGYLTAEVFYISNACFFSLNMIKFLTPVLLMSDCKSAKTIQRSIFGLTLNRTASNIKRIFGYVSYEEKKYAKQTAWVNTFLPVIRLFKCQVNIFSFPSFIFYSTLHSRRGQYGNSLP